MAIDKELGLISDESGSEEENVDQNFETPRTTQWRSPKAQDKKLVTPRSITKGPMHFQTPAAVSFDTPASQPKRQGSQSTQPLHSKEQSVTRSKIHSKDKIPAAQVPQQGSAEAQEISLMEELDALDYRTPLSWRSKDKPSQKIKSSVAKWEIDDIAALSEELSRSVLENVARSGFTCSCDRSPFLPISNAP